MEHRGLNEVVSRVNGGGPAATVSLEVALGHIARGHVAQARRAQEINRGVRAIVFPAVLFPVVSSNLTVPVNSVLLGPEDGQVWDVRRVTLAGWTAADAAINVNLWREVNSPSSGNPQNRLRKFNDNAPGNETWSPGGGLVLHSPDALLITGGPFTTTTAITLNIEGVAIAAELEAEYLI
jgi:hypothetical protein